MAQGRVGFSCTWMIYSVIDHKLAKLFKLLFNILASLVYFLPQHLALLVINAGRNNKRLRSEVAAKLKLAASVSLPATILQPPTASAASLANNFFGYNPLSNYSPLSSYFYTSQPQQQQPLQPQQHSLHQFQNVVPYTLQQQQQQQQQQLQPASFSNM